MYMLVACFHLPVSRQVRGTEEYFSSLADILSIADVIRLVLFLHNSCFVFRQQFGYFFFSKCVKCSPILYSFIIYKLYKNKANSSQSFSFRLPFFFWRWLCTIEVTFPDIANIFHIPSTVAGYEEIAVGFGPITNVDV